MKILEVSPYDLGAVGGVQGQVLGLADAFRMLGAEVVIAAPGVGPATDVSLGSASHWRANGSVAPISLWPNATRLSILLRWADVIHLHEPFVPMSGIMTLRQSWRGGLMDRLFVTFHRDGISPSYVRWAGWWSYLLPTAKHRIAVSPFAAQTVHTLTGSTVTEIPNGIRVDAGVNSPSPAKTPRSKPCLLFVGRHEERKGLAVALEALRSLEFDLEFRVVGVGPLTQALREAYPDPRIQWMGKVSKDALIHCYRETDIAVVPSLGGESFGVVLLEALAQGAPVVASDIPAYRWLSDDSRVAALFPPGDPAALARVVRELLGDPGRLRTLRTAGLEWSRQFSFVIIAERYLSVFGHPVEGHVPTVGGASNASDGSHND